MSIPLEGEIGISPNTKTSRRWGLSSSQREPIHAAFDHVPAFPNLREGKMLFYWLYRKFANPTKTEIAPITNANSPMG